MAGRLLASVVFGVCVFGVSAAPSPFKGEYIGVPVSNPDIAQAIPHCYIVVYNSTFDQNVVQQHQASVIKSIAKRNIGRRGERSGNLLSTSVRTFKINKWNAMALEADDLMINQIFADEAVSYIEQDAYVGLDAKLIQRPATTGLGRISHAATGNREYIFDSSAGEGITAFVVDTGIRIQHTEFEDRATFGANFINNVDDDENGHGSHVAGTIGGKTVGVAKNVKLIAVKVLDAEGSGTNSGVIAGMNFVAETATSSKLSGKAVMNMSLGGAFSNAVNAAINAIANAGVVPIVAAGNEAQDTARTSPGSAEAAITVGAIDQTTDQIASFSNFGRLVDIFAPGVNVRSVGITDNSAFATLSGTSMASPHVAGLSAYLMALENITSVAAVSNRIKDLARVTKATVKGSPRGTTNLIANNGNLNA
ncbi:serine protease [Lasiosphaeria miniovina]|uniref:Serine protease n=1 Tax=Lasiosphaeria miniovina TaxID=1954250 RepID=A0AA40ADL4_9PEZI|nr:serine protease [Lasiosphaeria miniovina]KAK0713890.1 serine protease [Lasiosphaeria miniovina]